MKFLMRKWRHDFQSQNSEAWYDLVDDWDLIESSFSQQYGIRLRKTIDDMEWGEFISLLAGLNGDTPLGNIVRIRSENDPKKIKEFNKYERQIRNEWKRKNVKQLSKEEYTQVINDFQEMFKSISNIKRKDVTE